MEFAEARRKMIRHGEGSIPHMYLDTKGLVTVGVGHMMRTVEAARKLPFVKREDKAPATADEIAVEYNRIAAMPFGQNHTARSFKAHTALILTGREIDALLERRIAGFEKGLRRNFDGYDTYPDRVRLGLMDMAFNLGNQGLVKKFPSFTAAARARDWKKCASECRRTGIGNSRNEEVKKLFEEADLPI